MKSKITLLELDDILPMAEYGIWIKIHGQANYISNNDIWNLILEKYGDYIACFVDAEGPLNDGGDPHVSISLVSPEEYIE